MDILEQQQPCPSRADLQAFEQGLLNDSEMYYVADHLASCALCEEAYVSLSEKSGIFAEMFRGPNPLETGVYQEIEYHRFMSLITSLHVNLEPPSSIPDYRDTQIGRYRVREVLGSGSFGTVYLADDPDLNRLVAIKVSRWARVQHDGTKDVFIREARNSAKLRDPLLVSIYDIGWLPDERCYLVLEYVPGFDLSRILNQESLDLGRALTLSLAIAKAVSALHGYGLLHRDLKPANILVMQDDSVRISDFGLSVFDSFNRVVTNGFAGTLYYMAPEQIRGEAHRLDVRTDIWSLGVVMYRLFTGNRPFIGDSSEAIQEAIQYNEPIIPSSIRPNVPPSIDRIILKCMAKRMSHRYSTVNDIINDLQSAQTSGQSERGPRVIPRGLRPFSESDHEAYMMLLPGLRDRDGLPEVVTNWKHRIESPNAFPVGALIGPSGVGKSSFFRAGLIPSLSASTTTVYLRATPELSDHDIADALKREYPDLEQRLGCTECIMKLRERTPFFPSGKTLIILDQFEQCLTSEKHWRSIANALRQCDGTHVLALVGVRDDYFLALSRFMESLDVELVTESNLGTLHLFDPDHARKVLCSFGAAFEKCPPLYDQCSRSQRYFIERVLFELADNDRLCPLHLALFCEMSGRTDWHIGTLRGLNLRNIGVSYLDSSFSTKYASETSLRETCMAILSTLLPPESTLADQICLVGDLATAAGISCESSEFNKALDFLEDDLRLIIRINRDQGDPRIATMQYRLTHDFVVQSVREWTQVSQMATSKGRARNCLATRTAAWKRVRDTRQLPGFTEWLSILFRTQRPNWLLDEKSMMSVASKRYATGIAFGSLVAGLLIGAALTGRAILTHQMKQDSRIALLNRIEDANIETAVRLIEGEFSRDAAATQEIHQRLAHTLSPRSEINLRLAIFTGDQSHFSRLTELLLTDAPLTEFPTICDVVSRHKPESVEELWQVLEGTESSEQRRLRAGCLLLAIVPPQDSAESRWTPNAEPFAAALLNSAIRDPSSFSVLVRLSHNARNSMFQWMQQRYHTQTDEIGFWATEFLEAYTRNHPSKRSELLLRADPRQFRRLIEGITDFEDLVRTCRETLRNDRTIDVFQQANAILALIRTGNEEEVWHYFQLTSDPTVRSLIIDRISLGFRHPELLLQRLRNETNASAKRALVLAVGRMGADGMSDEAISRSSTVVQEFQTSDDAGLNSACRWAIQQLSPVNASSQPLLSSTAGTMIQSVGHLFSVMRGPFVFEMGSPMTESRRYGNEKIHTETIDHSFAISVMEVSEAQFDRCLQENSHSNTVRQIAVASDELPKIALTWHQAVAYCNWLTIAAGMPSTELCYVENENGQFTDIPGAISRRGYRLPTEAEWEFSCRAGTSTSRYFGEADLLLPKYAHLDREYEKRSPCGRLIPNDLGLFDMLGNVREWCHDRYEENLAPSGPQHRMIRGGSYYFTTARVRSASRDNLPPNVTLYDVGFRIAQTVD